MNVLFAASFELPDQSANATRIVNLAKLMKISGAEPILLGVSYDAKTPTEGICDGIEYRHIFAEQYYHISKFKRESYLKSVFCQKINELYQKSPFQLIVVSGFAYQSIKFLIDFAKKKQIALAFNSVEWYEKNNMQFDGIGGKWKFIKNRYGMYSEHVKTKNIIGISALLADYYMKKDCNAVRIPTVVDKEKYKFTEKTENAKTVLAYAGSPGRKDYILNAIRALLRLSHEEKEAAELHLYGINSEQLIGLGLDRAELDSLAGVLFAHGRIPHTEVQEKIAAADFTFLLRPNLRYANAGFPTKVGESMMCGTPVIANHTGDLHMYIKDGDTGIVVENESTEAFFKGLQRAIAMSPDEKLQMRAAARKEAEASFHYSAYRDEMIKFIKGLKNQ